MKYLACARCEIKYAFNICKANISQRSYFTLHGNISHAARRISLKKRLACASRFFWQRRAKRYILRVRKANCTHFSLSLNDWSGRQGDGYPDTQLLSVVKRTVPLTLVYKVPTEETALAALDEFEVKWGVKYLLGVKSWRVNWTELSTMFKYPPEIRKLICTTNAIENFNRQLRKVTKTKSAYVSADALMKLLYLTTMQIVDKRTMPARDWEIILDNLMIYFGDRVNLAV